MSSLVEDLDRRPVAEQLIAALTAATLFMLSSYEQQADFFLTTERVVSDYSSLSARKEQVIAEVPGECAVAEQYEGLFANAACRRQQRSRHQMSMVRAAMRACSLEQGTVTLQALFNKAATTRLYS